MNQLLSRNKQSIKIKLTQNLTLNTIRSLHLNLAYILTQNLTIASASLPTSNLTHSTYSQFQNLSHTRKQTSTARHAGKR